MIFSLVLFSTDREATRSSTNPDTIHEYSRGIPDIYTRHNFQVKIGMDFRYTHNLGFYTW